MTELTKHIRLFQKEHGNTGKVFEPQSGLLYWDEQAPAYYEVYKELTGNFWIPNEISLKSDIVHWGTSMTSEDKEIYKRGISQLVLLDSVATVIDGQLAAYIQNPAIKSIMSYIASQEAIHNESYTYIASTFMTKGEAQEVFSLPKEDLFIQESSDPILAEFERFISAPSPLNALRAMVAMAALEGIRFTNGFTPFYLLNRNNKMLGTGQIIQYIQRDEIQHSYFQTLVAREIATQYPESNGEETVDWIYDFFKEIVEKEQALATSMYEGFSAINMTELLPYIEWRANILLKNLGLEEIFEAKRNPMPWINAYDPEFINSTRTDFFETRVTNYSRVQEDVNGWDDL